MTPAPIELLKARLLAAKNFPYFSTALWRITFHPAPIKIGPMGIDPKWRVYYNPESVQTFSLQTLSAALVHEINHNLRLHNKRVGERKPLLWNIASDMEINDDLQWELSGEVDKFVFPNTFGLRGNQTAEEYYDQLLQQAPNWPEHDCGSGAHGHGTELEEHAEDEGLSEAEGEAVRFECAKALKAGKQSRGFPRWASEILSPTVPWQTLLARYIRGAGRIVQGCVDYSYNRPSRRSWSPVILPRMISHQAQLGIVMDTSGSMHDKLLALALAEIKGIAKAAAFDSKVYFVDADLAGTGHAGDRNLASKLKGGGGTDMGKGIEVALKGKPKPDIIVVLTDGYTPWPAEPPVPVIVCIIGEAPQGKRSQSFLTHYPTPAWAKVVQVS